MLVTKSCPTLCDPMDCSPPGSSVHGILQARTLELVANPFSVSKKLCDFGRLSCSLWAQFCCLIVVLVQLLSRVPLFCDPMNCSPPGSSVHGISQARTLEWVAIPFSRESSQSRDQTQVSYTTCRFFTVWATREAQHLVDNKDISNEQMNERWMLRAILK